MTDEPRPARDAATVILARDAGEDFEVFMLRRHARASFMASAYVYPGGALDEEDCAPEAARHVCGLAPEAARARLDEPISPARALGLFLAGVRETFEEAGVLLAREPGASRWVDLTSDPAREERFAAYREALRTYDISLSEVAAREGLEVALGEVGYFARWITPYIEGKRFDARFFVARAPRDQAPLHDGSETTESAWWTPREALERYAAGEIHLAPPTVSTLTRLTAFDSVEALMRAAQTCRPPTLLPHFETIDERLTLLLPGDERYPAEDPRYAIATPGAPWTRMVLEGGLWRIA